MKILDHLNQVRKPGRYIGQEHNISKKQFSPDKLKVLLSYPDIYEIGMSNQGLDVLYEILNSKKDVLCERCFVPWEDMKTLLQDFKQPLYSLENKKTLDKFDVVAFTLQHELNYTNILTVLSLGNLKIWQKDREDKHPLIIGGGPCTLNPEPVADFFDFFIIGDAEGVISDVLEEIKKWENNIYSRKNLLSVLGEFEGVYVPSLFKVKKIPEGFYVVDSDKKIKKAVVPDLNKTVHPVKPVVPYIQTVHDRVNIEIMRGCPNSCRFCQARVYYGPARCRDVDTLLKIAEKSYKHTGYEKITLSSLSSGNYPYLISLIDKLNEMFKNKRVFLNFPSLWAKKDMEKILNKFSDSKRPGLTFAPEVTSEKMKRVISKNIEEKQIIDLVTFALNKGWKQVKLYYMLGLPGLTVEDLEKTKNFTDRLLNLNTKRKVKLKISFSTFIPKPHTALQWFGFITKEKFEEQSNFIRKNFSHPRIERNITRYDFSLMEAVLARADRSLSGVIYEAWKRGASFDSWNNKFNFSLWQSAFETCGVNYEKYIMSGKNFENFYPWDFIDTGISRETLWKNYKHALKKSGI